MAFVLPANCRSPGPLGRPRARGLERKKNTTRPLQRILHASGQRPGEFYQGTFISKGLRPHAAGPLSLEMRLRSGEVARCIGELRLPSGEVAMCIGESATQGAPGGARRRPGGSGGSEIAPRRSPEGSKIVMRRLVGEPGSVKRICFRPQRPPKSILGGSWRRPGSQEASGRLRGRFWEHFLLIFG